MAKKCPRTCGYLPNLPEDSANYQIKRKSDAYRFGWDVKNGGLQTYNDCPWIPNQLNGEEDKVRSTCLTWCKDEKCSNSDNCYAFTIQYV